jgi:aldehyde:ferredoxin oxidoreductase
LVVNDLDRQFVPSCGPLAGYHGRYLRVDVGSGGAQWRELPTEVLRDFLGGTGLGVYLMMVEHQAQVDALGPDACLAFVFSPLVGSPLTTSAKFAVVCKSPLTERYNDSLVSSGFAISGKHTGADAIVITGRAPRPSILVIDHGRVDVQPAEDLWGCTTSQTQAALSARLGADFQTAVIGPAGEHGVRFATLSHDGRHAGRGGSGAVLGAKNIKAVAVRGQHRCRWAQPEALYDYARQLSRRSLGPATAKYRELGTAANLLVFNRLHMLPTRNFQRGSFAGAEKIAPETLVQFHPKTRASCAACTIGCEHIYQIAPSSGEGQTPGVRLEYENLFALGSLCDVDDPDTVLRASRLCDELGMDTISAGGTIAFAMECAELGLLADGWPRFGDGPALLQALELTGRREGIGRWLAEGSRRLGEHLGPAARELAAHVKGLELPGYEPRAAQATALGLAVGARGADHNRSGAYEADFSAHVDRRAADQRSVVAAIESEDRAALIDSLILCKFLRGIFDDLYAEAARMLTMVCGWDVTPDELRTTSQRIVAAKKLFNIQAGWTPAEDRLPAKFLDSPLPDDPLATLSADDFRLLIRAYNLKRHWTSEGWIPQNERKRLRLARWALATETTASASEPTAPLTKANDR